VKLGAISFMTVGSIGPRVLAQELEAAGFESFWAGDHSHIPVNRAEPAPLDTRTGLPVPSEYWRLMDPFLVLTVAAEATSTIRLATGVCLVNERDPITTAKLVSCLDHISGGRFMFGIGGGWNEREMRDHGVEIKDRWAQLRERVEAMKVIWTEEIPAFQGAHVSFGPMLCEPRPLQVPHPPILIGGNRLNLPRVVAYGDGWCPGTSHLSDDEVRQAVAELDAAADGAGRDLSMTAFHVTSVEGLVPGSPTALTRHRFALLESLGIERVVVIVPPRRDDALRMVEHYSTYITGGTP
jgi:probable F420-dependent oxidoreductase